MIYMRGQARDYDLWRQMGCVGWGWDDVLPYFRKSEDYFSGADELHGAGGEWRVEEMRVHWDILDAFQAAAEAAGIPRTADFNRGDNEGSSYFKVNQRSGMRVSSAKAFLRPAARRPNLRIETGAQVCRLLIEENTARGVEFVQGATQRTARARREVVLAAGAIGTPHILQLSGVGPGAVLQEAGIPVLLDRGQVGENLQDHLQLRMAYKVSGIRTLNEQASRLFGKIGIGLEYLLRRSGPMAMAPSQLGIFTRSAPSYDTPNLQYHVQPLSLEKFGDAVHPFPAFTASVCNLRPESRGTIHAVSGDFRRQPAIRPNYLATETDRIVAAESIRLTRRIADQAPLKPYSPQEFKPGPDYRTEQDLIRAAGEIGTTIFHPVGTCRMGSDADSRRRRTPANARHRAAADRGCVDHAGDHLRQHQFADPDDRGKSGRLHPVRQGLGRRARTPSHRPAPRNACTKSFYARGDGHPPANRPISREDRPNRQSKLGKPIG